MKKCYSYILLSALLSVCSFLSYGQSLKTVETDIFTVIYNEHYQQPLRVTYWVQCPYGEESRAGLDFYTVPGVITSDNNDYKDNVWDKGHMAPAADFNCDKETLKKTFSYLNCALQHEGLNRGPWKELVRFERDLAKMWENINVVVTIHFDATEQLYTKGGASIPSGFTTRIEIKGIETWEFYFPNEDVAGKDWGDFRIPLTR